MSEVDATTSYGVCRGSVSRSGMCAWRGVPFARIPRRYEHSVEPDSWDGVRECKRYGAQAVQSPFQTLEDTKRALWEKLPFTGSNGRPEVAILPLPSSMSEDCCFLNITTLQPDSGALRPVMVWIHGGAFLFGSGSNPIYRGSALVKAGVVLVTINYRLGCFGNLNLKHLGGDANCGLWDQYMALRWVHSEIAAFGGDSSRVTIFGESAGGMSCGALLTSPLAQPYFARAIMMSGACSNVLTAADARAVAHNFCSTQLHGQPIGTSIESLRALTVNEMAAAQRKFGMEPGVLVYCPCVDGELVVACPLEALASEALCAELSGKQVMIGSNADEWALFALASPLMSPFSPISGLPQWVPKWMLEPTLSKMSARTAKHSAADRTAQLPGEQQENSRLLLKTIRSEQQCDSWSQTMRAYFTMQVFTAPARLAARRLSRVADAVWVYHYEFDGGVLGASHAAELPALFGTQAKHWALSMMSGHRNHPKKVAALSRSMASSFASFAATGSPLAAEPTWSRKYTESDPQFLSWGHEIKLVRENSDPASALNQTIDLVASQQRPYGVKLQSNSDSQAQSKL